jgi:hypothetical protein
LESTDYVDEEKEVAVADFDAAAYPEEQAGGHVYALVVSLHAVVGIHPPNAMLLPVTVKGERFLTLLNSGSTHTFIKGAAMHRIGLAPAGGEHLRIQVANGDHMTCEGVARNVPIYIGDKDFTVTGVGINLGAFDVILGFDFIRTLGPVLWDCDALTMEFMREGRCVTWQGVLGP